jgi:hypothetical protein
MATINLMDAGLMIIAQESDKEYCVTEPKYRVSLRCYYSGQNTGKIRVIVGTSVTFLANSLSDVLFEGQPALSWEDFREKEKVLFRNANTSSGSSGFINEHLSGAVDGSNATYSTSRPFVPETVQVYINGLLQEPVVDFQTTGNDTIHLSESPLPTDKLLVSYLKI